MATRKEKYTYAVDISCFWAIGTGLAGIIIALVFGSLSIDAIPTPQLLANILDPWMWLIVPFTKLISILNIIAGVIGLIATKKGSLKLYLAAAILFTIALNTITVIIMWFIYYKRIKRHGGMKKIKEDEKEFFDDNEEEAA